MTTLMRNGRDRRSENPFWAIARLERVLVFGTDQRITSGPAATVAASRWRQAFTRKQAAYMAAPERFAKRQIPLAPRAPSIHRPSRTSGEVRVESAKRGLADIASGLRPNRFLSTRPLAPRFGEDLKFSLSEASRSSLQH